MIYGDLLVFYGDLWWFMVYDLMYMMIYSDLRCFVVIYLEMET